MKNISAIVLVVAVTTIAGAAVTYGRGFGGFHGGGFGGGGFGGGGFHGGGGFGGGGFDRGGGGFRGYGGGMGGGEIHAYGGNLRPPGGEGGFGGQGGGFGQYHSQMSGEFNNLGFQSGGFRAAQFGPMRGAGEQGGEAGRFADGGRNLSDTELNSFLGLPTDMGLHSAGGERAIGYSGSARGLSTFDSAAAGERGVSGTVVRGANGTTIAHGSAGERGAAVGPNGAAGGSRAVSGTAVRGPEGNVVAHGSEVTRNWSSADMRVQGNYARSTFNNYGAFNHDWYRRYPDAWSARGYAAGVWSKATWSALNNWFGQEWPPIAYDYGDELTYVNNNVYLNDQPIATADEYYQSAATLAQTGEQASIPSEPPTSNPVDPANAKWLPLGVFEALRENEKTSTMTFQLAVNKAGIVRGNYFNTSDKVTQPLEGAVDKKTQRISWIVEDRKKIIFDTGLYNLTKDETAVLVHFGKDKTEQWVLVRLKQKVDDSATQ